MTYDIGLVDACPRAAIGMNHETVVVLATVGRHPERVEDEERRLGAVDAHLPHDRLDRVVADENVSTVAPPCS